ALLPRPRPRGDARRGRPDTPELADDAVDPALEERTTGRAHLVRSPLDRSQELRCAVRAERALERRDVLGHLGPFACHLGGHLEVELHAVRAIEAERLICEGPRA